MARSFGRALPGSGIDLHVERHHRALGVIACTKGFQRDKAWLAGFRQPLGEASVGVCQNSGARAEIRRDAQHAGPIVVCKRLSRAGIGGDIGAAKTIDGLLGIAHQEQRARPDREAGPVLWRRSAYRIAAQAP